MLRTGSPDVLGPEYRGRAGAFQPGPLSLSALERYQDCPFKFFASEVLRLEEPPEDDAAFSPRERGRFVHEVLQSFFEAWDRAGHGPITARMLPAARAVFAEAVEPLLAALSETDAVLERTRLFGSAISPGVVETRARTRGVPRARAGGGTLARVPAWRATSRSAARTGRRWRCGGGRPHRSAAGTPPAGGGLQVRQGARAEARAAGAGLRPVRPRTPAGARRRGMADGRGGLPGALGPTARSCRSSRRAPKDAASGWPKSRATVMAVVDAVRAGDFPPAPDGRDDLPLLRVRVGVPEGLRRR